MVMAGLDGSAVAESFAGAASACAGGVVARMHFAFHGGQQIVEIVLRFLERRARVQRQRARRP